MRSAGLLDAVTTGANGDGRECPRGVVGEAKTAIGR